MSLHTKYRPTTWKEVVGHSKIVSSMKTAVEKKLSRAFLLTGPSGLGKTTLARVLANAVGCQKQDLLEVDAATYTGIDDMRGVMNTLQYKPLRGDTKSIIIDECHALSAQAWKALLKSIEEPPSWVYIVLCTTDVGKVPKTIQTRCMTYNLKPVPVEVLEDLLNSIADKEQITYGKGILEFCAKQAQGSPRQAIVNMEACINAKNKAEAAELLEMVTEDDVQVVDLARALLKRASWREVQKLLSGMRSTPAESARHVIRAYMTNVILGAKDENTAGRAMEILDAFNKPFYSGDGISPLVLACGHLLLGE